MIPQDILEAACENHVVYWLGAGSTKECVSAKGHGLDSAGLADVLCKQLDPGFLVNRNKLPTIAKAVIEKHGREYLARKLASVLEGLKPTRAHRVLASVAPNIMITTNYNCVIEDAWEAKNSYSLNVVTARDNDTLAIRPLLYKAHGCIRRGSRIVITADDFVEFEESIRKRLISLLSLRGDGYYVGFIGCSEHTVNRALEILSVLNIHEEKIFSVNINTMKHEKLREVNLSFIEFMEEVIKIR